MANIISKGTNYSEGDTVTATNLNNHVDNSSFVSGTGNTTDNASLEVHTDGYIQVKDGGITSDKLASDAISGSETVVINNNNFTDNTIGGDKLLDGSISSDKLDASAIASLGGSATTTTTDLSSGLLNAPSGWGSNTPSARFSYSVQGGMVTIQWYLNGANATVPFADLDNNEIYYVLPAAIALDVKNSDHIIKVALAIYPGGYADATNVNGMGSVHVHLDGNTRVGIKLRNIANDPGSSGIWEIGGQATYPKT
jgi:hypothetical protein